MWLKDFLGFELKKAVIPAALAVIFTMAMLARSSYSERVFGWAEGMLQWMSNARYEFIHYMRPGEYMSATPLDDTLFLISLLIAGYLFSAALVFVHKHNMSLYARGKKIFFIVFLFSVGVFLYASSRYLWLDLRVTVFASIIVGYFLTTFIFGLYDLFKIRRMIKRLRKQKKLAKYFRWEFKYLK